MQVKPTALKKRSANMGSEDEFAGGEELFIWASKHDGDCFSQFFLIVHLIFFLMTYIALCTQKSASSIECCPSVIEFDLVDIADCLCLPVSVNLPSALSLVKQKRAIRC